MYVKIPLLKVNVDNADEFLGQILLLPAFDECVKGNRLMHFSETPGEMKVSLANILTKLTSVDFAVFTSI